jgi:hypothetical protein
VSDDVAGRACGGSQSLVAPGRRNPIPQGFACGHADALDAVGADGCFPLPTGLGLGVRYDWERIRGSTPAVRRWPS